MEAKEIINEKSLESLRSEMEITPEEITVKLTNFISEYMVRLERNGIIFGLSGGLDSAVIAALCARAVGTKKTLALLMPEKDSKKEHLLDAQEVVREFKIKSKQITVTPYLKKLGIYRIFPLDYYVPSQYRAKLVRKGSKYMVKQWGAFFPRTLSGCDSGLPGIIINRAFVYYRAKHRMRMLVLYMNGEMENRLVVGAANMIKYP